MNEIEKAKAIKVLEQSATQLDAMNTRSRESGKSFAELRPLIAELKSLWANLDLALKSAERKEQNDLRAPYLERMKQAATALCNNLYAALSRDRKSGAWKDAQPKVNIEGEAAGGVAATFAAALARRDFAAVHNTLAPWLLEEWTPEAIEAKLLDDLKDTMSFYEGMADPPAAGSYTVYANPTSYEEIIDEGTDQLPEEVTNENFRCWCPVTFYTTEEDGYLTNWDEYSSWFVVTVQTNSGEKIGYIRLGK